MTQYANRLTKIELTNFLQNTFPYNKIKSISIEKSTDTYIYGHIKVDGIKGKLSFSFNNFNFRVSCIVLKDNKISILNGIESYNQTKKYINKKYRNFMYKNFGERYYEDLKEYLKKDATMQSILYNNKMKLIEKTYEEKETQIKQKIAHLEKKLENLKAEKSVQAEKILQEFNVQINIELPNKIEDLETQK